MHRALDDSLLSPSFFSPSPAARPVAERALTDRPSLVGTWTVQVTLRDCATSAPLGPPFNSLVTFHGDGTLSESAGSLAFAPGQRSPGHGAWTRKRGHTFRQEMIALILFDTEPNLPGTPTFDPTKPVSPGFFAGWQTVTHTVRFTAADRDRVGRDQRLLQDERRVVPERLFDGDGSALLARQTGGKCRSCTIQPATTPYLLQGGDQRCRSFAS